MLDQPLAFLPILKARVWGGEALRSRSPSAPAGPIGESWEIADHGADTTCVANGPDKGRSLHEIFMSDRKGLCGQAVDPANPGVFPLLLKLIDAEQDLSVQVHPGDDYPPARAAGELGKTEAWFVLSAEPHGRIYRGVQNGVTARDFGRALAAGGAAELLHSFPARPGDVIHLPAGTIHALGAGVRIAEIQQNSDTTYRVFDWNRVGLDGRPRDLHLEHAMAVSRFGNSGPDTCAAARLDQAGCVRERFIDAEKFRLEQLRSFSARAVRIETRGRFHILTVVRGRLTLEADGGRLERGPMDSALVAAACSRYTISAGPDTILLLFYLP